MIETLGYDEWLYATLTADAALGSVVSNRVYSQQAPQGAALPYVLFAPLSQVDDNLLGGNRGAVIAEYVVRMVTQGATFGPARAGANRIDAVLHAATGTATVGSVHIGACVRTEPFQMTETVDGVRYNHLGGVYQITGGAL